MKPLDIAVVGAGPVGLALAVHAARALPDARITLFDSRAEDGDPARDARTLALSLASVQMLRRLSAWTEDAAQPIVEVHVSQQGPALADALAKNLGNLFGAPPDALLAEPELRICAADEGVPMLGAVLSYGEIVAPLQQAWAVQVARDPQRLASRFGTAVTALKNSDGQVEVDAGVLLNFDLAIVAEGGVFAEQARKAVVADYRQTAWVGKVSFESDDVAPGSANEPQRASASSGAAAESAASAAPTRREIGRASCRERVYLCV